MFNCSLTLYIKDERCTYPGHDHLESEWIINFVGKMRLSYHQEHFRSLQPFSFILLASPADNSIEVRTYSANLIDRIRHIILAVRKSYACLFAEVIKINSGNIWEISPEVSVIFIIVHRFWKKYVTTTQDNNGTERFYLRSKVCTAWRHCLLLVAGTLYASGSDLPVWGCIICHFHLT